MSSSAADKREDETGRSGPPSKLAAPRFPLQPPRLPEQDKLDAVLQRLRTMSPDEIHQTSVATGVHQPDGTLAPPYKR